MDMIWIRFTLAALPCASSETHTLNPALDLPAHFVGRVQAQEKERLTMKIEYSDQDIEKLKAIHSKIHEQTIIARNASDKVLQLLHELNHEHCVIASTFYESKIKP
jgi:hypothetical protein